MKDRFKKYVSYWRSQPKEKKPAHFDEIPFDKYLTSGIYSISVNGVILYIGESVNLHSRVLDHIYGIWTSPKNKYMILRELKVRGYTIEFDVLERDVAEDRLKIVEASYIKQYKPVLNSQHNHNVGRYVSLNYVLKLVEEKPQYKF